MNEIELKAFLTKLFKQAVAAADPAILMDKYLPVQPKGRVIVIGAGKASGAMAKAFETVWQNAGRAPLAGLVVCAYGNVVFPNNIETIMAAHPVPDKNSEIAARRMLDLVNNLTKDDLVVALISGGGSSLLSLAHAPISASDKREVNKALLKGGVPIAKMNCIRKHLSAIKGGQLAKAAYPAKVISLVISDVPGDDPALVASGPTIADFTSRKEALQIIKDYNLDLPKTVLDWLNSAKSAAPKPDDIEFKNNQTHLIAASNISLKAAAKMAKTHGINTHIISDAIEGEASIVGAQHAKMVRQIVADKHSLKKPILLLSGGETTVTLKNKFGKGGRNSEYLLSFAIGIDGVKNVFALAADTDGIDGSENNAGAYANYDSVKQMQKLGIDASKYLQLNDAYTAFAAIDDLIMTGATATNVNDFRAIFIGE